MRALIISPEAWGTMRISKHHYAIELVQMGYEVLFLEPLKADWRVRRRKFELRPTEVEGLQLIRHEIPFPYNFKFHIPSIFRFLISIHIRMLERRFGPFDIVWSYDINDSIRLSYFTKKAKKIFFAADWPMGNGYREVSKGADLILSVASEILELYCKDTEAQTLLLQHGVANCFLKAAQTPFEPVSERMKVAMTGNLLRPDINRSVLLEIVREHEELDFEFYGTFESRKSNLGGHDDANTDLFISKLEQATNVTLHGAIVPEALAVELRKADIFLICYDESKDQSKATNYHKVGEYLAYNRPIISNRISAHLNNPMIIQIPDSMGNVDVKKNFKRFVKSYKRGNHFENKYPVFSYTRNLRLILSRLSVSSKNIS